MAKHCNGFYEIEFYRLFRMQGRVLRRLYNNKRQLNRYVNQNIKLQEIHTISDSLNHRIKMAQKRVDQYTVWHAILETAKEEVSVNSSANIERAKTEKIINAAYAQAYANQI